VIDEYLIWIRCNFFETLNVESAARACGMSRRKFTADFRQRTGQTWLVYLNGLRIEHAKTLLHDTDNKVTSIAFQSGFEDLSTFYRTFKRSTGTRPLDYRA
jgi:AraC family L-rhamnose operon regulatory protein RhaS